MAALTVPSRRPCAVMKGRFSRDSTKVTLAEATAVLITGRR
jgi:hypothetical protein